MLRSHAPRIRARTVPGTIPAPRQTDPAFLELIRTVLVDLKREELELLLKAVIATAEVLAVLIAAAVALLLTQSGERHHHPGVCPHGPAGGGAAGSGRSCWQPPAALEAWPRCSN